MSEYGGQQQNLGQQNWQQPQQQPQYGMHPQGQSPQMLQQGVQNPRAPSPVMMQQMQMQNPNQGQMIHSSPPNMQMVRQETKLFTRVGKSFLPCSVRAELGDGLIFYTLLGLRPAGEFLPE